MAEFFWLFFSFQQQCGFNKKHSFFTHREFLFPLSKLSSTTLVDQDNRSLKKRKLNNPEDLDNIDTNSDTNNHIVTNDHIMTDVAKPDDYYDRYSRQHYVLGEKAMSRMNKANVFVSGLGGVGVEIGMLR